MSYTGGYAQTFFKDSWQKPAPQERVQYYQYYGPGCWDSLLPAYHVIRAARGCAPVGPALAADFPAIEKVVQFMSPVTLLLQYGDKRFQQNNLLFIDSTAFDVFSWKLYKGNPNTALVKPFSIVLTRSTAKKYFGNDDPVGKTLQVENSQSFIVTGLI